MKIERMIKPNNLFYWLEKNLPRGLEAICESCGYGYYRYIALRDSRTFSGLRKKEVVAEIFFSELILNHPQYFSDFEVLLRKYEEETGDAPTLKYWQSQKDYPIKLSA